MKEYHKIQTIYKRDEVTKKIIIGEYSTNEIAYLSQNSWIWTEKIDGTNIRVMWDGENVRFGGKTDNALIPNKLVTVLNDMFNTLPARRKMKEQFKEEDGKPFAVCLYGEGYGAGIQKGGVYRPDPSFILFDIKIGDWWLQRTDMIFIANALDLEVAPIIIMCNIPDAVQFVMSGQNISRWGSDSNTFQAEGLVGTPAVPLFSRSGARIITKIKYKDFHNLPKQTNEEL